MDQSKQWIINGICDEKVHRVSNKCGISPLLTKVFLSRGIEDEEYINKFLNPSMDDLYDPFLIKDMKKAVDRIVNAIKGEERIIIFGDYDVDGITSTSILYDFFKKSGANVGYYIPDRKEEGYGLSIGALEKVIEDEASLIITVDCGITAFEEIEYINEKGIDIIVTDHHECKRKLPNAYALVNPLRHDCTYPFKELAGVGVIFKLVRALSQELGIDDQSQNYIDLVALGTVADVVTLVDENRIIVKNGLKKIENTLNKGLKALIEISGSKDKKITSYTIGFVLAPRINAAGRIGDASRAVRLFTTDDEAEALIIAKELNEQNKYRQETERGIFSDVLTKIETDVDVEKEKLIVVWGKGWHHGIIGIVASKITESYNRPCILISLEDGIGKGSGRSIEGFNLFEALSHCASLLDKFGGHEQAAGLSVKEENLERLKILINEYADTVLDDLDLIPKIKIDIEVTKEDVSKDSVKELDLLAPFGAGNPSPVFAYKNLIIEDIKTVGNDKHLKLRFNDKETFVDAIGFNRGHLADIYKETDVLDAACSLEINSWNNIDRVQLNIKDLKFNEDTFLKNNFYYSLDKAVDFTRIYDDDKIGNFWDEITTVGFIEAFKNDLYKDKKTVVLINSINSLSKIKSLLDDIGVKYNIAYSEIDAVNNNGIYIIVNAVCEKFNATHFDSIMIYGEWICKNYLYDIIAKINFDKLLILDKICFTVDEDDIIVERQDMVAVYQYVKNNFKRDFHIENLFRFANLVSKSYRRNMNFFKVKRIIEIFEELNLFEKFEHGKYGMKVSLVDTKGDKVDLESSAIFQRFRLLPKNN